MTGILGEIWAMEELRKRILFTLGMLAVFRLGIFIPAPGIDREALGLFIANQSSTLIGMFNMFSGGALNQFSVFVLGIMPYITASIVMQLLAEMMPALKRVKEEGQQGQQKINQYTRYLTLVIAVVQSAFMGRGMEQMQVEGMNVVIDPGWTFRFLFVVTMTAGACFVMWLGEQMTERGIGNGSSILITSGIISGLPAGAGQLLTLVDLGELNLLQVTMLLAFMFSVVYGIVFVERGQRRIPLQYAKRVLGRSAYEGQTTYLPLRVNNSGVVPPIFASSLLMLPSTFGQFYQNSLVDWVSSSFYPGRWAYNLVYGVLVVFFAYFYTAITFNPEDVADNLRKQGGFIPKVRPGRETVAYIDWLLNRLTAGGSVYLAVVCILPTILISEFDVPFYFGGTSLLILVGVALDTVGQIEAQLNTRHYDGGGAASVRSGGRRRPVGQAGIG